MSVSSMTGFGRGRRTEGSYTVTVDIRSVNHRYLDLSVRMPRRLLCLEERVRAAVKERVERGKVEVSVGLEGEGTDRSLRFDQALAEDYLGHLRKLSADLGLSGEIRSMDLAALPGVFTMAEPEEDEEGLFSLLKEPLAEALDHFLSFREREGEALSSDIQKKLEGMTSAVREIEKRAPEITAAYQENLREKTKRLLTEELDEARIAAEVVLYADRICVDEELVRLSAHIGAVRKELEQGGAVGRKLDFLAQEMNREANTILSKSTDLKTSDLGISLKTDIEKIREQVQNLE